jgi:hypothetical protein
METTVQKPKLLDLVKQSSTYKLIVSPELEQKIRYYLDRFPRDEYSGTLFYTVSGSFETKDLVINAFDFLLQDIGTSGYTEFNQSPDVIGYMVEHPELLDEKVYQGLMHSHHILGAFFSGTDLATLREEGTDRIHFVSLIIDTKGTYQAAITRVVVEEMQATGFIKYPTFNGQEVTGSPITYSFNRKKLEYFMLDVERPAIENPFSEMAARIEEVKEQKAKAAKEKAATTPYGNYGGGYNNYGQYGNWGKKEDKPAVPTNPNYVPPVQNELPFEEPDVDVPPPYGHVKVDPETINDLAAQLVTGDINYFKPTDTTLDELARAGEEMFEQRFEDEKLFHAWAEQYVEFLVYYTEDPKLEMFDDEVLAALIAHDLAEVLSALTTKGKYINQFIEILNRYII